MASLKDIKVLMKGYHNVDQAARDVQSLTKHYKDLKPGYDNLVHPDGTKEQLFHLKGTIPVTFKGVKYNIPIVTWLHKTHPESNPCVFVTPTLGMSINQSRFVDANGRVYLPYLAEWKQNDCDLITLVQILIATFSDAIPVYCKSSLEQHPFANDIEEKRKKIEEERKTIEEERKKIEEERKKIEEIFKTAELENSGTRRSSEPFSNSYQHSTSQPSYFTQPPKYQIGQAGGMLMPVGSGYSSFSYQELMKEKKKLEKELDDLQEQNVQKEAELQDEIKKHQEILVEVNKVTSEMQATIQRNESDIAQLQDQLSLQVQANEKLHDKLKEDAKRYESLTLFHSEELARALDKISLLERQIQTFEKDTGRGSIAKLFKDLHVSEKESSIEHLQQSL